MRADAIVVGAGIAGVSTAHHLAVELGMSVALCDPRAPLTLTSDKSTECYRNWWPTASMVGLVDRSIDLMERLAGDTDNAFSLNRRGYLFVTADGTRVERFVADGRRAEEYGAGALRIHESPDGYVRHEPEGYEGVDPGADLILGEAVGSCFPYVTEEAVAVLHVRRAGWLSAQQLGSVMLERARSHGLVLRRTAVSRIVETDGRVTGVRLDDGEVVSSPRVVLATGPMLPGMLASWSGDTIPLRSEVHRKVAFRDRLGAVPRDAPMLIWADGQRIDWDADERAALGEAGRHDLLDVLPGVCHGRPEGRGDSPWVLALWEYAREVIDPVWPLPEDPLYPEVVLRGMATIVPELERYADRLPEPVVDGGYYTKTPDNRPVIGPVVPEGLFVCGALSGFGIMAGPAAGALAAAHVADEPLPDHAAGFDPGRFASGRSLASFDDADAGQL